MLLRFPNHADQRIPLHVGDGNVRLAGRYEETRKRYARFRKGLLEDGFTMMQFSVYVRHCPSEENATVHVERVERTVPQDGEVRILTFTDKQFERMRIFWGETRIPVELPGKQLELF